MKTSVTTSWNYGMYFNSKIDNHTISIDASAQFGGEDLGPSPKKLLLSGLAGCTGMDVVSILKKMRQEFTFFNIVVEANMTEEHPKHYDKVHIIYQFKKADKLDDSKVQKAIIMSQDQYCGVAFMFKSFAQLSFETQYID